jgi:hypothetical protein
MPSPESPLRVPSAMLLLGFGAALRRSELVGLRIGDAQLAPGRDLTVLVRRWKTDQHGRGTAGRDLGQPGGPPSPAPPRRSRGG